MYKRNYKLVLASLLVAVAIATGWATQTSTGLRIAGSKGAETFGRESSIAGSKGLETFGRESSIADSKAAETFGRESS
jgi:hypothetical protein